MTSRTVALALLGSLAVLLLSPAAAQAHAAYKESDPPDESSVPSAPGEIWAEFTEPPAQGSTLTVFNECGDRVDLGDSRIDGFRLYVGVDSSHRGGFRVAFRVTSAYDSHVTTGNFTFTATDGADCAGPPPEPDDAASDGDGGGAAGGSEDAGARDGDDDGAGSLTQVATLSERDDADAAATRERGTRRDRDRDRERERNDEERGANGGPIAEPPRDAPGIWDGIRVRDLLIGYAVAMLIGAAGGKIYAGIVGPRG